MVADCAGDLGELVFPTVYPVPSHDDNNTVPGVSVEFQMRISTAPNATPQSTPPSSIGSGGGADGSAGDEQYIWRSLVPRLVHPARLQIVEALIHHGEPMGVEDLAPLVSSAEGNTDLVRYHAKTMIQAGALEVVGERQGQAEGIPGDPTFFFAHRS